MGIVLNSCQYGVLYLGSYSNMGPYINFPHFGNSNLGKLPHRGLQFGNFDRLAIMFAMVMPAVTVQCSTDEVQGLAQPLREPVKSFSELSACITDLAQMRLQRLASEP